MTTRDLLQKWEEQKKEILKLSEKGIAVAAAVHVHLLGMKNGQSAKVAYECTKPTGPLYAIMFNRSDMMVEAAYYVVLEALRQLVEVENG